MRGKESLVASSLKARRVTMAARAKATAKEKTWFSSKQETVAPTIARLELLIDLRSDFKSVLCEVEGFQE